MFERNDLLFFLQSVSGLAEEVSGISQVDSVICSSGPSSCAPYDVRRGYDR